ncbi:hypothetical protein Q8A67_016970 [Cirrhinus molitorella]|uniref:Uncharacterized protein n=1 Tax=Cirrhinus molitorella TaxID=172907 RepID=A0AA88PKH1_9TELE|nr:hypothetical protein Q8A67_016970 [Cirrhinus molitorella]
MQLWRGDHRTHNTVPIEEESQQKKNQLVQTQTDVQQMIQDRMKKIEEIQHSVELKKKNTDKEKSASVEVFTDLIRSIERCQSELLKMMEEQQKAAEKQAEDLIKELQQEITDLKRRNSELEQLSHTDDHLHLIQMYSTLYSSLHTKNWTEISIDFDVNVYTLKNILIQLEETLDGTLNNKICQAGLKCVQKFAVDVTLDPDTANSYLILSNDGKQNQLVQTQTDVQQMIQNRMKKVQEIQHSVELRKRNTDKEKSASVELFTDLIRSIERCQSELLKTMEEQQKAAEKQAEDLIKGLQQEITDLKRRNTELEQLSHTDDHLHLIQMFSPLCSCPHTKNWTEISIDSAINVNSLYRALTLLKKTQEMLNEKLCQTAQVSVSIFNTFLQSSSFTEHIFSAV